MRHYSATGCTSSYYTLECYLEASCCRSVGVDASGELCDKYGIARCRSDWSTRERVETDRLVCRDTQYGERLVSLSDLIACGTDCIDSVVLGEDYLDLRCLVDSQRIARLLFASGDNCVIDALLDNVIGEGFCLEEHLRTLSNEGPRGKYLCQIDWGKSNLPSRPPWRK